MSARKSFRHAQRSLCHLLRQRGSLSFCNPYVGGGQTQPAPAALTSFSDASAANYHSLSGKNDAGSIFKLLAEQYNSDEGVVQALRTWAVGKSGHRSFSAVAPGAGSKVRVVSSDNEYEKQLAEAWANAKGAHHPDPLVLTQFTAQWCGPCRMIAPFLDRLSNHFQNVKVLQVDIDEPELSKTVQKAEISAVPTFQFHKAGKQVDSLTGADPKELEKRLKDLGAVISVVET